jgi:rare lipoprotein A (peptidoglycan hydrolase)
MLSILLKIMMKNKTIALLFILLFGLSCADENYTLRKIDSGIYERKYKGLYSSSSSGDIPIPQGKYQGVYKIGKPYEVLGTRFYPEEDENYDKKGYASWYGGEFHNRKTSNGEIYDMNDYTAAHTTLPMPSIVEVTNLENGKKIKVRINDRGPFIKGRIIDVSKRVAKELDFHNNGVTMVRVKYLKSDTNKLLKELGLK